MLRRFRSPLPVPPHMAAPELRGTFAEQWQEIVDATRPTPAMAVEVELATLLLVDLRMSGPEHFGADRLALLARLMRRLRQS